MAVLQGFSKLSRDEKINLLFKGNTHIGELLNSFIHPNAEIEKILSELSENTLANFPIPFGIAPNFLINNTIYHIPMVIEESSVVAAASKAAKIWSDRGGFKANVLSTIKKGQVHLLYKGDKAGFFDFFQRFKVILHQHFEQAHQAMNARGGGVKSIELIDKTAVLENYYQIDVSFETMDAMGANFINTALEDIAQLLKSQFELTFPQSTELEVIMSILSNYNPECLVECYVECPIEKLEGIYEGLSGEQYALKFKTAVDIANADVYRATTHNKGIFNGIDAVVLATGNDYRAVEAGGHAFAARDGHYKSLSVVEIENGHFKFILRLPLTVGTVGGITNIHPLTKLSFQILQNPDAKGLMMIIAAAGLAQNFAAVNALITSGIQKGHMKMHLSNILSQLQANESQIKKAKEYFRDKKVSFQEVKNFIQSNL